MTNLLPLFLEPLRNSLVIVKIATKPKKGNVTRKFVKCQARTR